MPLPTQEQIATALVDSAEKHFQAQVARLQVDIDNLITNTAGIDDHARIDNALHELFEKIAAEKDGLEAVQAYRAARGL